MASASTMEPSRAARASAGTGECRPARGWPARRPAGVEAPELDGGAVGGTADHPECIDLAHETAGEAAHRRVAAQASDPVFGQGDQHDPPAQSGGSGCGLDTSVPSAEDYDIHD